MLARRVIVLLLRAAYLVRHCGAASAYIDAHARKQLHTDSRTARAATVPARAPHVFLNAAPNCVISVSHKWLSCVETPALLTPCTARAQRTCVTLSAWSWAHASRACTGLSVGAAETSGTAMAAPLPPPSFPCFALRLRRRLCARQSVR